jgi:colanic acid/amylovoran biosynthesis glycosyltransferase
VPEEYFSNPLQKPPTKQFVVLQVGRMVEFKGHRFSLLAVQKIRCLLPDVKLRIVGAGELRREIEEEIEALGIVGNVDLVGWRAPGEVINEMRRAHVLIAPSCKSSAGQEEGLPNVVVEAMASGLPVVSTHHAGIPEALRYSESGWLTAERDSDALADRIERLVRDQELWTRLNREGREIARRDFFLPAQNARLAAVYRERVLTARRQ